ncbi:MAG: hypothetical protein AAB731_02455, partial [Patescibacteria group bacterium]
MKKIIFVISILIFLGLAPGGFVASAESPTAEIFYNEACSDCAILVKQSLPKILKEYGITEIVYRDYINESANRMLLREKNAKWGVPYELQSHIETFIGGKILLGGHIPENVIRSLLAPENQNKFEKILVYQDEMHGTPKFYRAWDFKGEVKQFGIDYKIDDYLNNLTDSPAASKSIFKQSLFWVVLSSGFLNGLHPCAFAVLLFFLSFLFSFLFSNNLGK